LFQFLECFWARSFRNCLILMLDQFLSKYIDLILLNTYLKQLLIFLIKLLQQVLNNKWIINLLILKPRLLFLNLLLLTYNSLTIPNHIWNSFEICKCNINRVFQLIIGFLIFSFFSLSKANVKNVICYF
jgi:hypothetical protein